MAKRLSPLPESQAWLDSLNSCSPFVQLEKGALLVSQVCERAREGMKQISSGSLPPAEFVSLVSEMYDIDEEISRWRQRPEWSFEVLAREDILSKEDISKSLPERVEIHRDIWMAYEWNYHRTGRILLHQQLLDCLRHFLRTSTPISPFSDNQLPFSNSDISHWISNSVTTIRTLIEDIFATVPQSFGDIDCLGIHQPSHNGPPRGRAIGSYLLLWPIRVIISETSEATREQKKRGEVVFDQIREHTGMKSHLGQLSNISNVRKVTA